LLHGGIYYHLVVGPLQVARCRLMGMALQRRLANSPTRISLFSPPSFGIRGALRVAPLDAQDYFGDRAARPSLSPNRSLRRDQYPADTVATYVSMSSLLSPRPPNFASRNISERNTFLLCLPLITGEFQVSVSSADGARISVLT